MQSDVGKAWVLKLTCQIIFKGEVAVRLRQVKITKKYRNTGTQKVSETKQKLFNRYNNLFSFKHNIISKLPNGADSNGSDVGDVRGSNALPNGVYN
jgi:hypothetical protein